MEKLNTLLTDIKTLEAEKTLIDEKVKKARQEVFNILEAENMQQYKNPELATVSYVERKTVKYQDREAVLNKLVEMNLPKYFEVIPEHKEIKKTFEDDIKKGQFNLDGVEVEVKKLPMIRFNQ